MIKRLNIKKNFIYEISQEWDSGDLIIVSSRPKMGKTAFALSLIHNFVARNVPSRLISLYTKESDLLQRLNNFEIDSCEKIFVFNDLQIRNMYELKENIYRLSLSDNIRIIFIDNLEYISADIETYIQLKKIAQELSLTIIISLPLDSPILYEHTKPSLSSLTKKIKGIDKIADYIYFIYRPAYYSLKSTEYSLGHIIISKSKRMDTGYFPVCFNKSTFQFTDYDSDKIG